MNLSIDTAKNWIIQMHITMHFVIKERVSHKQLILEHCFVLILFSVSGAIDRVIQARAIKNLFKYCCSRIICIEMEISHYFQSVCSFCIW